ncbi:hypothetical protein J2Z79_003526 [Symbiobacterium terraclitae]|uniref:DUF4829 domain-containing protein n=1 Tax=Symbiobacterium terraclitae TaxID=557451 RepID=A0ABS4JX08_9FIRM|nr:hypothetical protein [Symbiobacterium terraclitae]MBP2020072.1 hypothetical protein [Symbiobacterium terraclitae]
MRFLGRLFGRRQDDSPAARWMRRRTQAEPAEVVHEYFSAVVAHDLEWILATLTPERARLYSGPTTMDRRRLSVRAARVTGVSPAPDAPVARVPGYGEQLALRVEYELELVPPEERRDPSLVEGPQWAYFLLVREGPGKPWLIADWGR